MRCISTDRLGRLAPGYEADLVVLDPKATPLMAFRNGYCRDIVEQLFMLMVLGDDRAVRATYVAGETVYDRERSGRSVPLSRRMSPWRA